MFSADLGGAPPAAAPAATDPPFQKVALLLHGDDTNGAQNNTFLDSSTNNFTITRAGNVAQGTFSPFSLAEGQWSNYFDGTGDYLETAAPNIDLLPNSFTIECWVNPTVFKAAGTRIFATSGFNPAWNATNGIHVLFQLDSTGKLNLQLSTNTATPVSAASSTPTQLNAWTYVAAVYDSVNNQIRLYINGAQESFSVGSVARPSTGPTTGIGTIPGETGGTTTNFSGYISNLRIVTSAVYTSTFTPPTSPLTAISGTSLLTCQSNRFKDNSSNNFTITRNGDTKVTAFSPFAPSAAYDASTNGGSGYFDGSGDYLTVPSSSNLAFGTGDATIEFWAYPTAATSSGYIFDLRYIGGVASYFYYNNSSTTFEFAFGGYKPSAITLGNKSLNTWTHFAIVRVSGTVSIYINGILAASGSGTSNMAATGCSIGSRYSLDAPFYAGYISNLRMIVGTALYTSNFAPPTAPLTAITNTQLLLNCTNAGIIDNAGKNDIETVGNAQVSTSVKKYGTGSMYFDGTGDYLKTISPDGFTPGTSDFTIEAWIYPTSSTIGNVFSQRFAGGITFRRLANGTIDYFYGTAVKGVTSTLTAPINTWTHIALTRSGSTVKLWVNGVNSGTNATYSGVSIPGNVTTQIGTWSGVENFTGYIDDLRITKGQALYTSNFTPPTQAFPNV